MKIQMLKALAATSALAAMGFGATAANAATADGTARAKILRQVTVTNTSDLQFGTIVTGAAASTVGVSTAGARTCGGGLVCSGTTTAANFNIVGTAAQIVTISVPGTVSLTSGANSMSATLVSSAAPTNLATLSAGGTASFTVGGTLSVGAAQADGDYAGTFTATVNYQ